MWLIANVSGFSAEAMGFTHDLPAVNSSGRLSSLPPLPRRPRRLPSGDGVCAAGREPRVLRLRGRPSGTILP